MDPTIYNASDVFYLVILLGMTFSAILGFISGSQR
jgi:hypothetical protein